MEVNTRIVTVNGIRNEGRWYDLEVYTKIKSNGGIISDHINIPAESIDLKSKLLLNSQLLSGERSFMKMTMHSSKHFQFELPNIKKVHRPFKKKQSLAELIK